MMVSIPCSFGELIDKLTILEIKRERIQNEDAQRHVEREWAELNAALHTAMSLLHTTPWLGDLRTQLLSTNTSLWDLEERVRWAERQQEFGPDFVACARAIYAGNDERARIKREINRLSGSTLVEVKSHAL
jgi:hypothetical protein